MLELIQDQRQSSPTASNQHKPRQHDNQPHASHCPIISSRERTLQPTTIPTYHRHIIIDASHRTVAVAHNNTTILPYSLHHSSKCTLISLYPLLYWTNGSCSEFYQHATHEWREKHADRFKALTTSYQSPAMKMAHILHCKPYPYHIKKCTFGIADILTRKEATTYPLLPQHIPN